MQSSIECAAVVLFGVWDPIENLPDFVLTEKETPESLFIQKEKFKGLSHEAKELANILIELPENFFKLNGKVRKIPLKKACREIKGWSGRETEEIKTELRLFLKALDPASRNRSKTKRKVGRCLIP